MKKLLMSIYLLGILFTSSFACHHQEVKTACKCEKQCDCNKDGKKICDSEKQCDCNKDGKKICTEHVESELPKH
jgi:hypothetical protein